MNLHATNKLKVAIETSIGDGFSKLSGQLAVFEKSLQQLTKLTPALDKLSTALDVSATARKNATNLDKQRNAQGRLNKEIRQTIANDISLAKAEEKLAKAMGNTKAAVRAQNRQIILGAKRDDKGIVSPEELKRVKTLVVANTAKAIKSNKDTSLISLIPKTADYRTLRKSLQTNIIDPMLEAKKKAESIVIQPPKINFGNVARAIRVAAAAQTKELAIAEKAQKRQDLINEKQQSFRTSVLNRQIARSNLMKNPDFTMGLTGTSGYNSRQKEFNKTFGKNSVFESRDNKLSSLSGTTLGQLEIKIDEAKFRRDFLAAINSLPNQVYTPQFFNASIGRQTPEGFFNPDTSSFNSDRKMFNQYGYGKKEAPTPPPLPPPPPSPLDTPADRWNSLLSRLRNTNIPGRRSQAEAMDFSQKLYKSYAKLGEILFRIQYATLTIANLGGFVAFTALADTFMSIESSIGRVSSTAEEFNLAMSETRKIARETYQSYESVAGIYSKIAFEANKYNLTQEQTLKLTRTISTLAAAGGGKTSGTEQAIYQFQQSISSGKFGGDELRSVFEGAPMLARALAAGMQNTTLANADISKLRPVKGGPNVNTKDLLIGLQTEIVQEEVKKLANTLRGTFGGAIQNLVSSLVQGAGKINQITGATVLANRASSAVDDYFFMDQKDANSRAKSLMDKVGIPADEMQAEKAKLDMYWKNIQAIRELTKQLVFMAAALVLVKAASLGVSAVGGLGRTLVKPTGLMTAARTGVGAAKQGASIVATSGLAGLSQVLSANNIGIKQFIFSLGKIFINVVKLVFKFTWFIVVVGTLWTMLKKLTEGTDYAGKELRILWGLILMLGDAIKPVFDKILDSIGKFFSKAASLSFGFLKWIDEQKDKDRVRRLKAMNDGSAPFDLGAIRDSLRNMADGGRSGFDINALLADANKRAGEGRVTVPTAPLTGGGFGNGGPATGMSSPAGEDKASKAKEKADEAAREAKRLREAIASATKAAREQIESINLEGLKLDASTVFGNFFSDIKFQDDDELKSLRDSWAEIGRVPKQLLDSLSAAQASRNAKLLNKEIRDGANNFSVGSRAGRLEREGNMGSLTLAADSSSSNILQNYIKYFKGVEQQNLLSDAIGDTKNSIADIVDEFKTLGLSGGLLENMIVSLREEVSKFAFEIKKLADEMTLSNNKSVSDTLFNYNQQAKGIFGRDAENGRAVYDAEQSAKEKLITNMGGGPEMYGKSLEEISNIFRNTMDSNLKGLGSSLSFGRSAANSGVEGGASQTMVGGKLVETVTVVGSKGGTSTQTLNTTAKVDEYVAQVNRSVEIVKQQQALMDSLLASPWIGAQRAISLYLDSVKDVASQTEGIVGNLVRGLEDSFTNLILSGNANLDDLARSVLADVTRMYVKQSIVGPIAEALQGSIFHNSKPPLADENSMKSMFINASAVYINGKPLGMGGEGESGSPFSSLFGGGSNKAKAKGESKAKDPFVLAKELSLNKKGGDKGIAKGDKESNSATKQVADIVSNRVGGVWGTIVETISSVFSKGSEGIGGILKSIFSIFSGGKEGGGFLSTAFSAIKALVLHSGGMVGSARNSRSVDPNMFVGAPRFHTGTHPTLGMNEVPAILKSDEMVLTRSQQGAIRNNLKSKGSSYAPNVMFSPNLVVNYNASDGGDSLSDAESMGKIMNQQIKTQFKEMLIKEFKQGGMLQGARR
jgi:tape measure domain-containing protein